MLPELAPGLRLPELRVAVTAKTVIMGAAASRDWQPQHHDAAWAVEHAGLPGIIMNNYTQAGWISRYVTDWSGPSGRLGRLRMAMRRPICPGDELVFSGVVENVEASAGDIAWVAIAIKLAVAGRIATEAQLRLALPATPLAASPWRCPAAAWRP